MAEKKSGWGGKRANAGRKSKSEEDKTTFSINEAVKTVFGGEDKFWLFMAKKAKEESNFHTKTLIEYWKGKAKERVEVEGKGIAMPVFKWDEGNEESEIDE